MRVAAFPSHLDSNPYCDLLYNHLRELGVEVISGNLLSFRWLWKNRTKLEVLHLHWIERYCQHWRGGLLSYFTLLRFILHIRFAKLLGYKIVWTMHNFISHESANVTVDRMAASFMAKNAATAVHCDFAAGLLGPTAENAFIKVIPHGNYIGIYPQNICRKDARNELGISSNSKALLFLGMIRMYKGIRRLCEAFLKAEQDDSILLVVGKPYEERDGMIVAEMVKEFGAANIRFELDFIPPDEVAKYFIASDFAVFPYRDVLTSGSVILAMGFGCPVVAPRIGCLTELEKEGVGIFYDPASASGLENAIGGALESADWKALSKRARSYAESLSWKSIAEDYLSLYRSS